MFDWLLFLSVRNARMCNRWCLCSSMTGMLCTAFWVPSRAIHTIRCCPRPESYVLILDWKDYMLDCRKSCWRACWSGWFSIFWINCWTLVLCACFTLDCDSPGIRKSMSASFIICSWLKLSRSITHLSVLSGSVLVSNVGLFAFMKRMCLRTIWHILCLFQ